MRLYSDLCNQVCSAVRTDKNEWLQQKWTEINNNSTENCTHSTYRLIKDIPKTLKIARLHLSPRHWNTRLVSNGASLTSSEESVSLALVGNPSSDGVTIKMPYGVDVLHRPASHPIFSYWLVKTESGFIVRSVETGLGRWMLVVVVISVHAYPFLAFSDLTCQLDDTGIGVFCLHCAAW